MEYISILQAIILITVGTFGYILNRRLREDTWARTLRDFHQFFWTDPDCKEVRSWIACDNAYNGVDKILDKTKKEESLTKEEYNTIEKIDKFLALLLSYKQIERKHSMHGDISNRLFDSYWIKEIRGEKRKEFLWYLGEFYPELIDYSDNQSISMHKKIEKFITTKTSMFYTRLRRLTRN